MATRINDKQYNYTNLSEITSGGFTAAQFPEIRDAIIKRMMEIYGNDIDVSDVGADGQYINMEANIVNNMYRLLENLYNSMNPSIATGKFLDILCSFSNVNRINESYSTAQVFVKNVTTINQTPSKIQCVDRANNTWTWINPIDLYNNPTITIKPNEVVLLEFTCDTIGPISAQGTGSDTLTWDSTTNNGWIYQTVDYGTFLVYQSKDAVVGNTNETDPELRDRRYKVIGSNSTTVQSGLESALYDFDGIKDVYIINNNSGADITNAGDKTTVKNHNVYIALRYKEGVTIDDSQIGTIIYNKLTPGVNTQEIPVDVADGEPHSYTLTLLSNITTNVYWKKCTPIHPQITINFVINDEYIKGSTGKLSIYEQAIVNELKKYLDNIKINERLQMANIQSSMINADLKRNGNSTFYISGGGILGESSILAQNTYYKYTNFVFSYNNTNGTLTIN